MAQDAAPNEVFKQRFLLHDSGEAVRRAIETLLAAIAARSYEPSATFVVRLALEEALSNAFKHGNRNDPSKKVTLECRVGADAIVLDVQDEGEGFDPKAVPDPTEEENLEIPSGRGIVLMRSFMSAVEFTPPGNRVRMTYRRPA
jgi:serine/threonine-protein kinase RsbW